MSNETGEVVNHQESAAGETHAENTEASETLESMTEGAEGEGSQEEVKKSEEKEKGEGAEKRIKKLIKQRQDKERELEYWKAQALKQGQNQENQQETKQEPKKLQAESEPQEQDFDTYKDYLKAQVKWELAQEKKAESEKAEKAKAQETEAKRAQEFRAKLDEFQKSTPDFFDKIESIEVPVLMHVQEAIRNSDMPAQVMYELAGNPEEIERLNKLSVVQAAKEIGKLEARLSVSSDSQTETQQPKKITKAPSPIAPVGGKASSSTKKSLEEMSFKEYQAARMEQMKKKRA